MFTIGNFNEVLGNRGANNLIASDLDAVFGLAGNDTLSATEDGLSAERTTSILIGGSGEDLYQTENNSGAIILENARSNNDIFQSSGINFGQDSFISLEIDEERHLIIGDTDTNQRALLIDWQLPENRIETFELAGETISYQNLLDDFRTSPGYLGSFTWEEAVNARAIDLDRLGFSLETIDESIAQADSRAKALESREPIGNSKDVVGSEEADNILGTDLQALYGLAGDDTLKPVEVDLPAGVTTQSITVVGGSGDDNYQLANNTTAIVLENGNDDNDVGEATGIGFFAETSFSLEIDEGRHLFIGDIASNQYALLLDWQVPENRIETFVAADGTFSYDEFANGFRDLPGHLGSVTWEEAIAQQAFDLEKAGLTVDTIDEAIAQVDARSAALEAEDPLTGEIVYRFFNPTLGGHLYTVDVRERDFIVDNLDNYSYEGASYKAADPLTGSPVSVYRFFNPSIGVHLYTINEVEKDFIIDNLDNYVFEGAKFSAYQESVGDTIPIYRFYEPSLGVHFYTPNEVEKDFVIDNLDNYNFEGIAYYANPVDLV